MFFSCSQDEQNEKTPTLCNVYEYKQTEEQSEVYYSATQLVIISNLSGYEESSENKRFIMEMVDISKCAGSDVVEKDTLTAMEIDSEIDRLGLRKIATRVVAGDSEKDKDSFFKKSYQIGSRNKEQYEVLITGREGNSSVEIHFGSDGEPTSFDLDEGFNYELYNLESDPVSHLVIQLWKPNSIVQLAILRM